MMPAAPIIMFLGDAKYSFALTATLVLELETKCGAIGALANRIFSRNFGQSDLHEVIRLALIGGGTSSKRAAEIIAAYVADRPLVETYPIAANIIERVWFGAPHEVANG